MATRVTRSSTRAAKASRSAYDSEAVATGPLGALSHDELGVIFDGLADLLGIWHEMRRGSHNGVHELWCGARPLLLVNLKVGPHADPSPYAPLAPHADLVFSSEGKLSRAIDRLTALLGRQPLCPASIRST